MQQNKTGKKLCFIAPKSYQLFNPRVKSTFGGAEVQFYILAKELAKDKSYDIGFVVGDYGQSQKEKFGRITLHKFCSPKKSDNFGKKILYALRLWIMLRKIKADIYLTTTSNSVTALVSTYCKFHKARHCHRTSSDEGVNLGFVKKNGLMGKLYKYGLENSDLVITQNDEHKRLLLENHSIEAYVLKNSATGVISAEENKNSILWVSRCHPLKKPEMFLGLANVFTNEKFLMICPPSSGHKAFYQEIKRKAENHDNLEFIDFVPFENIQKYFDRAKVYVCTSDYEGFPNTLIQSGIGKTPYLSLNVNPDGVLTKFNCGIFAEGSLEKLKAGLKRLIENKDLRSKIGDNIHKYTLENHNTQKNCEKFKKLVTEDV